MDLQKSFAQVPANLSSSSHIPASSSGLTVALWSRVGFPNRTSRRHHQATMEVPWLQVQRQTKLPLGGLLRISQ